MSKEEIKQSSSKTATESDSQDIRSQLQTDLTIEFTKNLYMGSELPNLVRESLATLLNIDSLTSEDIIATLNLEDPSEPEVPSE
jgi:hypothetical protein